MTQPSPLTAVPAWWDPKARTFIVDDSTILCGILVAGPAGVVFASPDGIAFEVPAGGLRVTWSAFGTACRLSGPETYLVYLAPPTDGSPRLNRSDLLEIAARLSTARDLADVAGLIGDLGDLADVFGIAGLIGDGVKTYSAFAALRQAKRSRRALRHQFALIT